MASAFAESPSVRMSVHLSLLRPPASLASSSLGMPTRRPRLAPSVFFSSLLCLKAAKASTLSTTPVLSTCGCEWHVRMCRCGHDAGCGTQRGKKAGRTFFMNSSEISHLEPKELALVVSVSFVWQHNERASDDSSAAATSAAGAQAQAAWSHAGAAAASHAGGGAPASRRRGSR